MANRFDISDNLIHFTTGKSLDEAFATLRAIIDERRLIAGSHMIRGGYRCVSFTETPLAAFAHPSVTAFPFTRYSGFGVMFEKSWIYDRGGRHVIYQPDSDFQILPEELRWRHVRFEPTREQAIDFTWEREWRMQCDELLFSQAEAIIVLPNEQWAADLRRSHHAEQDIKIELYSMMLDEETAELWREPFRWRVVALQ